MADCVMYGRCVGVRNYTKKDKTLACVLTVACSSNGSLLEFLGDGVSPMFPFGTLLRVEFNIHVFSGKPSSLHMESYREVVASDPAAELQKE